MDKIKVNAKYEIFLPERFLNENNIIPGDELIIGWENKQLYCKKK